MANITNTSIDLDINFDKNPLSGDVALRKDEEAIKRSLRNLLLFRRGEKPFHPEINSGIQDMLFELTDPVTVAEMRNRIGNMIKAYEPRVTSAAINVVDVIDKNEVRITIQFTIRNVQRVFSTTVALKRLR
jgi:phage baseplate assembly protein W